MEQTGTDRGMKDDKADQLDSALVYFGWKATGTVERTVVHLDDQRVITTAITPLHATSPVSLAEVPRTASNHTTNQVDHRKINTYAKPA